MSYDVVAMERWMNVLLAQRLDGHVPTTLPLARRLGADSARPGQGAAEAGADPAAYRDQAIGEELRATSASGEVAPSSYPSGPATARRIPRRPNPEARGDLLPLWSGCAAPPAP